MPRILLACVVLLWSIASLASLAGAAEPDAIDREIARLTKEGFSLVDYHIHLKGGLTLEEALEHARKTGVRYGIAINGGVGFPTTNDRAAEAFLQSLRQSPQGKTLLVGMQAEGREWMTLFSKETIAKFDYIFSDAMTIVDAHGRRAQLWKKEQVEIPDAEAFMERLIETIVGILDREPIDIYANPTYLPDAIASRYDQLWTAPRVKRVIDAAATNGVAIEISNRLRLPKADFIKQAKLSGIKFTFGTNNADRNLGRPEYALEMIRQCGLTPQDMWSPKPDGRKPVQVRKR